MKLPSSNKATARGLCGTIKLKNDRWCKHYLDTCSVIQYQQSIRRHWHINYASVYIRCSYLSNIRVVSLLFSSRQLCMKVDFSSEDSRVQLYIYTYKMLTYVCVWVLPLFHAKVRVELDCGVEWNGAARGPKLLAWVWGSQNLLWRLTHFSQLLCSARHWKRVTM